MSAKLKPYPAYRKTDLPWLGQIPAHWDVTKVKCGFDIRLGKMLRPAPLTSSDTLEPYLRAANIQWQDVDTNDVKEMWFSQWEKPFYELCEGDLMVCEGGDVGRAAIWQGQLEKCYIQNSVHRVRNREGFTNKFLYYWLVTLKDKGYIDLLCNKATIAHFTADKFAAIELIAPPLPEQQAIAAYLDHQTAKIDALIAKKERLLDLLAEQRAAIISQAVTKGLNPDVKIKDSGVAWLGQVPKHWEVDLVKRHFDIDLGKMLDSSKQPEHGFLKPYLRAANIYWEGAWLDDVNEMKFTKEQLKRYRLQKGDLLVTEGGATVGRSTIWQGELEEAYYQNSINRARPKGTLPVKFLYYWLYALKLTGFIDNVISKATFGHLTKDKLQLLQMTVPPKQEAEKIADYIETKLAYLARIEDKIKDVIERLREYRAALISSVVTGKIQVT